MAIVFPNKRKMHVTRIAGTNDSGEILDDVWVDVARIDEIILKTQDALHFLQFTNQFQEVALRLKWGDQDGRDDNVANRTLETLKVCSPDEDDINNPAVWVEVPVIRKFDFVGGNVTTARRFLTRSLDSNREVEYRRVVHHDTNIDTDAQVAFESGFKTYRVPDEQYVMDDGSKDDQDYVEVEVPTKISGRSTHHWVDTYEADLDTAWRFKNEFLIQASDEAQFTEVGEFGFNPPYRLDPFQAIINVQFGKTVIVVINAAQISPPGGLATYEVRGQKAKFLGSTSVVYPIFGAGFSYPANTAWAFKVSSNAGTFIDVKMPAQSDGFHNEILINVFAIDPTLSDDDNLQRALNGTKLTTAAWVLTATNNGAPVGSHDKSDIASQADPPGLLWSVRGFASSGEIVSVKIHNKVHRDDGQPLDKMVQAFPAFPRGHKNVIPTLGNFSGYQLGSYRLDQLGTGRSYAIGPKVPSFPSGAPNPGVNGLLVDTPWLQSISTIATWYRGIPYGDKPPLVKFDTPSQGGGLVPPYDHI